MGQGGEFPGVGGLSSMVLFHALFGLPEYKGPKTKDHFSFYQFLVAEITVKLDVLLGSLLIWLES